MKKLLIFALTLTLACSAVIGTSFTGAKAAEKKVSVSETVDDVRWTKQGDETKITKTANSAYYLAAENTTWPNLNFISSEDTVKGDKTVYAEIEIDGTSFGTGATSTSFAFQPYNLDTDSITDYMFTTGERTISDHTSTGNYASWVSPECVIGGGWGTRMAAAGNSGWERKEEFVTKILYVGRPDGSISMYLYEQDEANRTADLAYREKMRTKAAGEDNKNYYPVPDATKDYHITIALNSTVIVKSAEFGTLEESAEDLGKQIFEKGTKTPIASTNVADGKFAVKQHKAGTVYASKGKIVNVGGTVFADSSAEDMLVTAMPVYKNEVSSKVFSLEATLRIESLAEGKKVGFAVTELEEDEITYRGVTEAGVSFVYFEKSGDNTVIGLMNGGTTVKTHTLENVDLSDLAFSALANKDGTLKVAVGGSEYAFENVNVDGEKYIAFAAAGEGNCKFTLADKVKIIRYDYTRSDGKNLECNFNQYMDPADFMMSTTSTTGFRNQLDAVGLEKKDGKLMFNGSGSNTVFCAGGIYADFVVEFDYISYPIESRPEKIDGWMYGYSDLTIAFGNETPYGWGKGAYQLFIRDFSTRQWSAADEPYQGYGSVKLMDWAHGQLVGDEIYISDGSDTVAEDGSHTYASAAKEGYVSLYAKTTKLKLVVADNVATLYAAEMIEGKELADYTAADYVKLGEWNLPDAYEGRVSVCADENAYFAIDNYRITRLDGETEGAVAENLAAYEDFRAIADDPNPVTLDTPVLSLDGNTVKWEAVENADGYAVSVNGGTETIVSGTSYTIDAKEDGDYVVTVKALGSGAKLLDSETAAITYTKGGSSAESGKDSASGSETSSSGGKVDTDPSETGGCFGAVSAASAAAAFAAIGAMFIVASKKRKD